MTRHAEFISAHIGRFGLCGSNNLVPRDWPTPARGKPLATFTRHGHFEWGFGQGTFNDRESGAQTYWTSYGRPGRPHEGFRAELTRAVVEIGKAFGPVSITADGGYISEAAIAACKIAGLRFEQVVLEVEDFRLPPYDASEPTLHYRVSGAEFQAFAERFGRDAGCPDAWLALEALHGVLSPFPHIYDGYEVRLVNNSYDTRRNRLVGRANWSLVDNEQYTAIDRWLLREGKTGVPSILRWSPELLAAQIDSPQWRQWLRISSRPMARPSPATWLNRAVRLQLALESFPGVPMVASMGARRGDAGFSDFMRAISVRMSRWDASQGSQHHYPLDRLAQRAGIAFDFDCGKYAELYGHVHD
jgi:hypothetical protein